jgi:hypothetical protein
MGYIFFADYESKSRRFYLQLTLSDLSDVSFRQGVMSVATRLTTMRNIQIWNTVNFTGTTPAASSIRHSISIENVNNYKKGILSMNTPITLLARMATLGALVVLAHNAQSQLIATGNLYQDAAPGFQFENYNNGNNTEGNQIVLAGSAASDLVTSFSFQYDYAGSSLIPAATADVFFYENNGPDFGATTYAEPDTQIWTSGSFSLGGYTTGATMNFYAPDINGGAGVVVPQDFTWVVAFSGLQNGENAGLALYSPATVGANFNDAWVNDGSGWDLVTATPGDPALDFGAVFNGTVPDSSCLPVSVLSVLAGFGWMKRFQRRA